jgi:hypothetical protein
MFKQKSGLGALLTNPILLLVVAFLAVTSAMKLKRLEEALATAVS